MDERIILGAADEPLTFPLVLASDHKTPAVGVTPSLVRISKNGGAFAAPSGAVSAVGNGWYQVAGNATDTGTVGPLLLHVEATGCDPLDMRFEIVPNLAADPLAKGSPTYPLTFLMIDSADHIAGKTGLSPTVTIAKVGGSFATPAGAVSEIGFGWYAVGPNPDDYSTPGPVLLHATATGADPTDDRFDVAAVPTPTVSPVRDDDAFIGNPGVADPALSMVGLLQSTGWFDPGGVVYPASPGAARLTADMQSTCTITPTGVQETDEGSQKRRLRRVGYKIALRYRAEEGADAAAVLGRIDAAVHNVLQSASLGGFTLPWLNRIEAAVPDDSSHPDYRLTIRGLFVYAYEVGTGLRATA
jgi:hypothetical protein